jgi:putative endonuclease
MSGFAYVLLSKKDNRTYTGSTDNLNRRINEHNRAKVNATKHRLPFLLIYIEQFATLIEARRREKYLKTCAGRKKLHEMLFNQ